MACQTSFFLIRLITFICTDLLSKKMYEATKEKKDVIQNWSHLNLRRHNFDFHLCNTVVVVDLFVVVAVVVATAATAAAAAVVVPVVAAVGKIVQQQQTVLNCFPNRQHHHETVVDFPPS